jgi:hypothetical protein
MIRSKEIPEMLLTDMSMELGTIWEEEDAN